MCGRYRCSGSSSPYRFIDPFFQLDFGGLASCGDEAGQASNLYIASYRAAHPLKTAKGGAAGVEKGASKTASSLRGGVAAPKRDVIATATALTARSIRDAIENFVLPRASFAELIVSGGGAKNPTLIACLANEARELGLRLRSSDEFGIPSEAKEAVAFAVLAFETWNRRPSNVPSATGASRPAILGKISYP
jgi:1,6-anhydro-N-acetylmuramate kinase